MSVQCVINQSMHLGYLFELQNNVYIPGTQHACTWHTHSQQPHRSTMLLETSANTGTLPLLEREGGREDEQTDRQTDGRTDGQTDRRTDG